MKKLLLLAAALFLCVPHAFCSMKGEFFILSSTQENVFDQVSLVAAQSVPYLKNKIKECKGTEHTPSVTFTNATKDDLMHIKEYIIRYHQMNKGYDNDAEKHLYDYARALDVDALMRLTRNACAIFPKDLIKQTILDENVPKGLLNPVVAKLLSGQLSTNKLSYSSPFEAASLEKYNKVVAQHESNKKLLFRQINDKQESIVTHLLAPYLQDLDQSTELPAYRKSVCEMIYKPIVEYVYVGNAITASLSGTAWSACPHYNYVLTLHKNNDVQTFTLNDKKLDFNVEGTFANKDESLFACPYSNPDKPDEKGVFVVVTNSGTSVKFTCSGKTVACFVDGCLLSFNNAGKIFILSAPNKWEEIRDTQCSGMKGLINDEVNDRLIYWNENVVFDIKNIKNAVSVVKSAVSVGKSAEVAIQEKVKNENSIEPAFLWHRGDGPPILDVIIDPTGKNLCIKTFSVSASSGESTFHYHLGDCAMGKCIELSKTFHGRSLPSFSPDGNVLIVSSGSNNNITHDYFDTFSLKSWQKKSAGELLAVGKDTGTCITQTGSRFYYQPHLVTLFDQSMSDALGMLTDETFNPFKQPDTFDITDALFQRFTGRGDTEFEYPPAIKTLLLPRTVDEPKKPDSYSFSLARLKNVSLIGLIFMERAYAQACRYRTTCAAIMLVAIAGMYKMRG